MDLWIEFYFALSEKWAVGVMGCRSNGLSELWAVGIMLRIRISVIILKIAKPIVSKPITMLINKTIEIASFPNKLKEAQVVPSIKRTANWRLVTIDLSVYYQWCRSSSREPYMNNFHIILKIYVILFYLHLDQVLAATLHCWKLLKNGKKPLIVLSIQLQCLLISRRLSTAYLMIFWF